MECIATLLGASIGITIILLITEINILIIQTTCNLLQVVCVYIKNLLKNVIYLVYMKNSFIYVGVLFLLSPLVMFAQFGEVDTFFTNISTFINNVLIPLLFAFALLFFIYGLFRYFILGGADEGNREKGRSIMIWSIVAFVMAVSIWGIVNAIAGGLSFDDNPPPRTPTGPEFRR